LVKILAKYLDSNCIQVINGGVEETTDVLKQRFDHIFYTGNGVVGKIIMKAAAENLTPVTLELGGKSPCIIDNKIDLKVAVPRLIWGKFTNAGQICIAPDYVLVHKDVQAAFLEEAVSTIKQFYGQDPRKSSDYSKIVNENHVKRLTQLLKDGGKVHYGGDVDAASTYISPTIVTDVNVNSRLMTDEIFGPILPVIPVESIDEAVKFVNARPKPLVLYVFSKNSNTAETIIAQTSSGATCVNECLMHAACNNLPFGGVGASGMGAYNGKYGFDTFSHAKAILKKPLMSDPSLRFPPYTETKLRWLTRLNNISLDGIKKLIKFAVPVIIAAICYIKYEAISGWVSKTF